MYFCEMYPTCVSSKLCEFITFLDIKKEYTPEYGPKANVDNMKLDQSKPTSFHPIMTERTSYGVCLGSTLPAVWKPASPYSLFSKLFFSFSSMFSSCTRMKSSRSCRTGVSWLPTLTDIHQKVALIQKTQINQRPLTQPSDLVSYSPKLKREKQKKCF